MGGPIANQWIGPDLASRERYEPGHDVFGALGGHREGPRLLELITPEVEPSRVVRLCREHIDDPAPHRELATCLDPIGTGVSEVGQGTGKGVHAHLVAGSQDQWCVRRRAEALNRAPDAADHDCPIDHFQGVSRLGAVRHGADVRRHMLERQRLPGRGEKHVVEEQGDVVDQLLCIFLPGHDHEERGLDLVGETGNGEGTPTRRHGPGAVEIG